MTILHLKSRIPIGKDKKIADKILDGWDLDMTGKVINYAAQFQVRYSQLKENKLVVV